MMKTMPEPAVLRICAYGCNLQIESSLAGVVEAANIYVLPTMPRVRSFDGPVHGAARIEAVEGGLRLEAEGTTALVAPDERRLMQYLIRVLDDAVIRNLRGMYAVHAGTVAWRGGAILLPGLSHAGKSSLVAELLRRGATYYSDEYAMIDETGRVHPYPRPVLLRNGGLHQEPVLPGELNASVGRDPVPMRWVFAVSYNPGGDWQVAPMEQSETLFALLKNTPHVLEDAPEMLSFFHQAVLGVRGCTGERGEAAEAAEKILALVDAVELVGGAEG